MCKVARIKYSCRHTVTEYQSECSDRGGRCEKQITTSTSKDQCPKCSPDSRQKKIVDLYAQYTQELKSLAELAKAESCKTMTAQLEQIIKSLPDQRIKALAEMQEKVEMETAAKKRIEAELAQESSGRWQS